MGEQAAAEPRCSRKLGSFVHFFCVDDGDAFIVVVVVDDNGSNSHAASVRPRSLPPRTSNAGDDDDDDEFPSSVVTNGSNDDNDTDGESGCRMATVLVSDSTTAPSVSLNRKTTDDVRFGLESSTTCLLLLLLVQHSNARCPILPHA